MLSILFGLGAAFSWGAADFFGGLASRKAGAHRAIFYGEGIGILFVVIAALAFQEDFPTLRACLFAALAGMIGTFGILLLYQAMTLGLMSIATPVSALMAAVIPIVIGAVIDGLPKAVTLLGFVFALFAIWFISRGEGNVKDIFAHIADLKLPLLAGVGFGLYFVIIHEATREATLWPMVMSRSAGMLLMTVFLLVRRDPWEVPPSAWPLIAVNGFLDVGGNFLYIVASRLGRFDVAAILSSLFPASTVLLAALFLKERVSRPQMFGIALALIAIVLMTV
ncbi:MAG: GRP family sugar transporter [Chloroflexota bacterium]